jgi:hypothetical protein
VWIFGAVMNLVLNKDYSIIYHPNLSIRVIGCDYLIRITTKKLILSFSIIPIVLIDLPIGIYMKTMCPQSRAVCALFSNLRSTGSR